MNEVFEQARRSAMIELNWCVAFLLAADCPAENVIAACSYFRDDLTALANKVNDPELPLFLVWLDAIEAVAREGL